MTSSVTRLRPAALSGKTIRERLAHRTEPVFTGASSVIDQLKGLYNGLVAVRENQSPLDTAEARALTYKRQYDAALERANGLIREQVARFADFEVARRNAAYEKAGLHQEPAAAAEIRATLRAMTQKARDKALTAAAQNGDVAIIGSVIHAPSPILTGEIGVPVAALTDLLVHKVDPALRQDIEDYEFAETVTRNAWHAFQKSTGELRDARAEDRAVEGAANAKSAEGRLAAAMQGVA